MKIIDFMIYFQSYCSNTDCRKELVEGQPVFIVLLTFDAGGEVRKEMKICCSEKCRGEIVDWAWKGGQKK